MNRRRLTITLALAGIIAAVLAVHTIDAPVQPDAVREMSKPAPLPENTQTVEMAPVLSVSLPPPPMLAEPTPTVQPLAAEITPVREVAPMVAKTSPPQNPDLKIDMKTAITPMKAVEKVRPPKAEQPLALKPMSPKPAVKQPAAKRPASKIIAKPTPKNPSAKTAPAKPIRVSQDVAQKNGRPLLRLLEHGDGPSVEIAWPRDRRARTHLHRIFAQCYGMRVALLAADGRLFDADSPRGTPWAINTDRFSGFVRRSSGGVPLEERQTVMRIRNRHGLGPGAAPVRVFPRRADAALLGGLSQIVGSDYRRARRIQATYRLADNRVRIDSIRVDGAAHSGAIDLSQAARRGCTL